MMTYIKVGWPYPTFYSVLPPECDDLNSSDLNSGLLCWPELPRCLPDLTSSSSDVLPGWEDLNSHYLTFSSGDLNYLGTDLTLPPPPVTYLQVQMRAKHPESNPGNHMLSGRLQTVQVDITILKGEFFVVGALGVGSAAT